MRVGRNSNPGENPPEIVGNPDFEFGGDGAGKPGNYAIVKRYLAAGLNPMPIARGPNPPGGWKRPPKGVKWGVWQERTIFAEEVGRYWCRPGPCGIGIVCGAVSGNLECLDFDTFSYFLHWSGVINRSVLDRCTISATPANGRHVWYRCPEIQGNQKLAQQVTGTDEKGNPIIKTHIETRGQGGQFLAPGTPADCHPKGRPYLLIQGTPETIPTITPAERRSFLSAARAFNTYTGIGKAKTPNLDVIDLAAARAAGKDEDEGYDPGSPWSDFNTRAGWGEILEPLGWQVCEGEWDEGKLTRPGKDPRDGASASVGRCGSMLHVFSTNAYPFEGGGTYSRSAAWALLRHNGDFSTSAKDLIRMGYGEQARERKRIEEVFARIEAMVKGNK